MTDAQAELADLQDNNARDEADEDIDDAVENPNAAYGGEHDGEDDEDDPNEHIEMEDLRDEDEIDGIKKPKPKSKKDEANESQITFNIKNFVFKMHSGTDHWSTAAQICFTHLLLAFHLCFCPHVCVFMMFPAQRVMRTTMPMLLDSLPWRN